MKTYMNLVDGVPSGILLDKKQADSFPVIFEERPNETLKTISESYFYELDGKRIVRKWDVRNKTQAEIDAIMQLKHWRDLPFVKEEAAKKREKRNLLLAKSDWTQVADAPVDQAAWAGYRQALRDIPAQAGFPNEVTWPTEP